MSLLHPGLFAIGLACVSIPILIHLLKRRRRVVSWGAMRFLEEAYRKRRRIITLEQLILLTLRCLLIVFIALGVGSLMLGSGNSGSEPTTMVIVLDDSIGSAIVSDGRSAFERNQQQAIDSIEALDQSRGDQVALISASSPARAVVFPPSDDLGAVMALVREAGPSDAGMDMAGVIRLLGDIEGDDERPARRVLMFASDGRTLAHASSKVQDRPAPALFDEMLLADPAQEASVNIGVHSARPTRALVLREGLALPEAVRVEMLRSGDVLAEQSSTVRVLDEQSKERGQAQVEWEAGQREASLTIAIDTRGLRSHTGSSSVLHVSIDEDSNNRDNTLLFTISMRNTLRVGVIDRPDPRGISGAAGIAPGRWARAALAPGDGVGVEVVGIDASQAQSRLVPNLDAVLVLAPAALAADAWERIARLQEQGVMVIVTPDAQSDSLAWFEHVREMTPETFALGEHTTMHSPNLGVADRTEPASLLAGIEGELPMLAGAVEVFRSLAIPQGATPIATLSDGSALGVQIMAGDGAGPIVLLAVPFDLNWSNLPARPLFVAMLQELVRQGVGLGGAAGLLLAGDPLAQPAWVQSTLAVETSSHPARSDRPHALNQYASLLAMRDAQGTVRSLSVVQPNSAAAIADTITRPQVLEQFQGLVDSQSTRWVGDESAQAAAGRAEVSSTDARSLALTMLWIAIAIAVVEFVLARLFTARLIASEQAMGTASGVGGRS